MFKNNFISEGNSVERNNPKKIGIDF